MNIDSFDQNLVFFHKNLSLSPLQNPNKPLPNKIGIKLEKAGDLIQREVSVPNLVSVICSFLYVLHQYIFPLVCQLSISVDHFIFQKVLVRHGMLEGANN